MSAVSDTARHTAAHSAVRDCWNVIGVQGDASCPELKTHIHCRNCAVYSAAARRLLDAPLSGDHLAHWTNHFASPRAEADQTNESVLIFRCAEEWLALPTATCSEVADPRAIHSLPHRRHASVLGLVNIRGELIVCLSLSTLLGVQVGRNEANGRLLVINNQGLLTALQVDAVHGTHRFLKGALKGAGTVSAVLRWRDHMVGVLDVQALLASVTGSLA